MSVSGNNWVRVLWLGLWLGLGTAACGSSDGTEPPSATEDATTPPVTTPDVTTPVADVVEDSDPDPVEVIEETIDDTEVASPEVVDVTEGGEIDSLGPDIEEVAEEVIVPDCTKDSDCEGDDPCLVYTCVLGACESEALQCDDGDPCTADSCETGVGCVGILESSETCCFGTAIYQQDLEQNIDGMFIDNFAPGGDPPMNWNLSTHRARSGERSLYFGDPDQLNYDNGDLVGGSVAFSGLALPVDARSRFIFHLWAEVEAGYAWDIVTVRVDSDNASTPVWTKNYNNFVMSAWQRIDVDLGAFAGQTVKVIVSFNTVEHTFNSTEGIYP